MFTTLKTQSVTKWTWSGTGFVRESPGEKQLAAPNRRQVYKRARYYDANTGEFISRDPLEYVDGVSQYRAYFVPGGTDPTGRLRFDSMRPKFGKCGALYHKAYFQTDKGEHDGIIVQKVCFIGGAFPCPLSKKKPDCKFRKQGVNKKFCKTSCFLELWQVNRRGKISPIKGDTFAFPPCMNSWGARFKYGVGIFIPNIWIVENKLKDAVDEFVTGENGVVNAGGLRSACYDNMKAKDFWEKAHAKFGANSTRRFSAVFWNCCCRKENTEGTSWAIPEK